MSQRVGELLSSLEPDALESVRVDSAGTAWETFEPMDRAEYDPNSDGVVEEARRTVIQAFNATGSPLVKGTVVYISGKQGDRPRIAKASAVGYAPGTRPIGVVDEDIGNMAEGQVVTEGTVYGDDTYDLDTDAWDEGTALYLDPANDGWYTDTRPIAPDHAMLIGYVGRSHQNVGEIIVHIEKGDHLEWLHDVLLDDPPTNGDVLTYNSTSGLWENAAPSGGGGVAILNVNTTAATVSNATTDTHSYTVAAGKLDSNGDALRIRYSGDFLFTSSGSLSLGFRFADTTIGDLNFSDIDVTSTYFDVDVLVIRTSSTAAKVRVQTFAGDTLFKTFYQEVTTNISWSGTETVALRISSNNAVASATTQMSLMEFLPSA